MMVFLALDDGTQDMRIIGIGHSKEKFFFSLFVCLFQKNVMTELKLTICRGQQGSSFDKTWNKAQYGVEKGK